jgi:hypothetical protein
MPPCFGLYHIQGLPPFLLHFRNPFLDRRRPSSVDHRSPIMYLTRLPPSSCICNSSHCAPTTYDTVSPSFTPPYQAVLDPETGVMLRPLSYLGAARPLMLPLLSPPSLSVPTGPLYRIYRTNFGRCRDLDA